MLSRRNSAAAADSPIQDLRRRHRDHGPDGRRLAVDRENDLVISGLSAFGNANGELVETRRPGRHANIQDVRRIHDDPAEAHHGAGSGQHLSGAGCEFPCLEGWICLAPTCTEEQNDVSRLRWTRGSKIIVREFLDRGHGNRRLAFGRIEARRDEAVAGDRVEDEKDGRGRFDRSHLHFAT